MNLRVAKYNGYNLDNNHNPVAYNPYLLEENSIVQRYNFYVVEEGINKMVLLFGGMTRLRLPFQNFNSLGWNCTVDWGDGIIQNFINPIIPDHTYSTVGDYTVKITGFVSGFNFQSFETSYRDFLKEIIRIDNIGLRFLRFTACGNLTKIHDGVFEYFNKEVITNCEALFHSCVKLEYVPPYMFKDFINVTTFGNLFTYCRELLTIPVGFFDNCYSVIEFSGAFHHCKKLNSVPNGLFNSCHEVQYFTATFGDCDVLRNIPSLSNCLKVTHFFYTFAYCYNLIGDAPDLWNRTNVQTFQFCFRGCGNLSNFAQIPSTWK